MAEKVRIALTGFMGVGKSSVARHLSSRAGGKRIDLDQFIERSTGRKIVEIIDNDGLEAYRAIETAALKEAMLDRNFTILSLGGGTWTVEENRETIRSQGLTTVWLESTFDHCWQNIRKSRKERPLARNRSEALKLFEDRQRVYCLADWHYIVRPDMNSYEIADQIFEEVFC